MVVQPGTNLYTLVVSQYERNNTIHYTLRVYASTEFKLTRIVPPYNPKYDRQVCHCLHCSFFRVVILLQEFQKIYFL